jgi:hypothetical protein
MALSNSPTPFPHGNQNAYSPAQAALLAPATSRLNPGDTTSTHAQTAAGVNVLTTPSNTIPYLEAPSQIAGNLTSRRVASEPDSSNTAKHTTPTPAHQSSQVINANGRTGRVWDATVASCVKYESDEEEDLYSAPEFTVPRRHRQTSLAIPTKNTTSSTPYTTVSSLPSDLPVDAIPPVSGPVNFGVNPPSPHLVRRQGAIRSNKSIEYKTQQQVDPQKNTKLTRYLSVVVRRKKAKQKEYEKLLRKAADGSTWFQTRVNDSAPADNYKSGKRAGSSTPSSLPFTYHIPTPQHIFSYVCVHIYMCVCMCVRGCAKGFIL